MNFAVVMRNLFPLVVAQLEDKVWAIVLTQFHLLVQIVMSIKEVKKLI